MACFQDWLLGVGSRPVRPVCMMPRSLLPLSCRLGGDRHWPDESPHLLVYCGVMEQPVCFWGRVPFGHSGRPAGHKLLFVM